MELRKIPPDNLDIVFEKANVDYDKMRNLLWTCQPNPGHANTKSMNNISIYNISTKKKSDDPFLQLADLVVHALYKCIDKQDKNFGIPEPRYLRELAPRFFGHPETQAIVGAGLFCVHSMKDLKLDNEVEEVINSMVENYKK